MNKKRNLNYLALNDYRSITYQNLWDTVLAGITNFLLKNHSSHLFTLE